MPIQTQYYTTPVGELILGVYDNHICLCDWRYRKQRDQVDKRIQQFLATDYEFGEHDLLDVLKAQLSEYFKKARTEFDIPLLLCGSDFQKSVWEELIQIGYGEAISYLELSKRMGDVKAIRAVANTNGANAISIVVPCHRIIGSDGSLTGYAGGLTAKKKLLELEGTLGQMELF